MEGIFHLAGQIRPLTAQIREPTRRIEAALGEGGEGDAYREAATRRSSAGGGGGIGGSVSGGEWRCSCSRFCAQREASGWFV